MNSLFYIERLSLSGLLLVLACCFMVSCSESPHYPSKKGAMNYCVTEPVFIEKYEISRPWAVDLSQQQFTGIRINEVGGKKRAFAIPAWQSGGHLVSYEVDDKGNIFVCPAPYVSLDKNPPKDQNKVYKIDSETGEFTEFINLPKSEHLKASNPFGSVGLAFDCESNSLYVSSLAGSTYQQELGTVYQIDLNTGKILNQLEGLDVLGMAMVSTNKGKLLLLASARASKVFGVDIREDGAFNGAVSEALTLISQYGGGADKGVRIRYLDNGLLEVKAMEFSFSLIASSDPLRNIYTYRESDNGDWEFVNVRPQ